MLTGPFLGVDSWSDFARWAAREKPFLCDLRRVHLAYPPGTVALLLLARHRNQHGWATTVVPPEDSNVLNYLERVDFFRHVSAHATVDGEFEHLRGNRRNPTGTFTELITPAETGFDKALEVIWNFFTENLPEQRNDAFGIFEEVFCNISDHSMPDAPAAHSHAQVQIYQKGIELGFGDLGIGFRDSLAQNPDLPRYPTQVEALRSALVDGKSRLAYRSRERGGGLRRAFGLVRRMGGVSQILTYDGAVLQQADNEPGFGSRVHAFPGTLVRMWIPRRA